MYTYTAMGCCNIDGDPQFQAWTLKVLNKCLYQHFQDNILLTPDIFGNAHSVDNGVKCEWSVVLHKQYFAKLS